MTRLEAIIYAIGKLDGEPMCGMTNEISLHDCHECFEEGYLVERINIRRESIYLTKVNNEGGSDAIMYVNRSHMNVHEVAVLIDNAYGMHSKRHKNK